MRLDGTLPRGALQEELQEEPRSEADDDPPAEEPENDDAADEEEASDSDAEEDEEAADDQGAKRAFETFKESGACESSGALFEVSLDFRRCPRGGHADHPMFGSEENTDPAWIAQRLSTLRWI